MDSNSAGALCFNRLLRTCKSTNNANSKTVKGTNAPPDPHIDEKNLNIFHSVILNILDVLLVLPL